MEFQLLLEGVLAASLGAGLGSVVTLAVEAREPWSRRLGRTRLRLAALPVGGSAILIASLPVALAGATAEATLIAAFGLGAAVQAPVMALGALLPPLCSVSWTGPYGVPHQCVLEAGHFGDHQERLWSPS